MILLINAYSARNAGDAAIVLSTAQLLAAARPGTEVRIATRYWLQDQAFYAAHGMRVVPPPLAFPPRGDAPGAVRAGLFAATSLLALLVTPLLRLWPGLTSASVLPSSWRHYLEADTVCAVGGGYLYSSRRTLDLTLLHNAAMMVLARLWGKRLVMMPQSIGPITSGADAAVVRAALRATDRIVVRERVSMEECQRIGSPRERIDLMPDVAFFAPEEEAPPMCPADDPARRTTVGLVAMDWVWARPGTDQKHLDRYIDKLAAMCVRLHEAGLRVRVGGHSGLPAHGQDDFGVGAYVWSEALRRGVPAHVVQLISPNGDDTLSASIELIQGAGMVVGTRLHSCILSLRHAVPALALGYQPKSQGTYALLGLDDLYRDVETFDPDEVAAKAVAVLDDLRDESGRVRDTVYGAAKSLRVYYAVPGP